MEKTAIVSRKGGVGKTTATLGLGAGLRKRGKKVLYIDLDSQANLTYLLDASQDVTSLEVLTNKATAKEAIQHTQQGDIIAACEPLAGLDTILQETGKEYRLQEALKQIENEYDFVLIDTPAQLGTVTINAMTAADNLIITAQAEPLSYKGIGIIKPTIDNVKKYCNKDLYIKGILVTLYNPRNTALQRDYRDNLEEAAKQIGTKVFKQPMRAYTAIKEAQDMGVSIYEYAPKSNAAEDNEALVKEYLQKGGKHG